MNEMQIIAKIQEIVGLQDQISECNKLNKNVKQLFDLNDKRHVLISEIEPHLELKKFDNAVITNFKIMLLSLKFVNEKDGTESYMFFFQKVKNALANANR
jgi:hypothetical protein